MVAQQIQVDARLDIEPFHIGLRHHVGKIAIACFVLAQQHQMAGFGIKFMHLIKAGTAGHIDFTADDRMDALRLTGTVKIDGAVHDAVVRDRHRRLPHLLDQLRQVTDTAGAVEQAIFRMNMEMCKRHTVYSSTGGFVMAIPAPCS